MEKISCSSLYNCQNSFASCLHFKKLLILNIGDEYSDGMCLARYFLLKSYFIGKLEVVSCPKTGMERGGHNLCNICGISHNVFITNVSKVIAVLDSFLWSYKSTNDYLFSKHDCEICLFFFCLFNRISMEVFVLTISLVLQYVVLTAYHCQYKMTTASSN